MAAQGVRDKGLPGWAVYRFEIRFWFFRTVGFRFAGVDQADYPFHVTKFVRHSDGHRGRDLERLISLHEVVIDGVQTEHMQVVFQFLTECVGQPRESPNTHPHGQVVPFHV